MIAPIAFGIGVHLKKSCGKKWFANHFSKFDFSISPELFKQSALCINNTQEDNMTNFVQWVANNVDHNIRTLTGKGTFHGMGIIVTSSSKFKYDPMKR